MRHLRPALILVALQAWACGDDGAAATGGANGSAGGSSPGGSAADGGASSTSGSGGDVGSGGGGVGGEAVGGAGAGGAGACEPTPGTVACGAAECDLASEYCCGGPGGECFAIGAFCGLGGAIKVFCDDAADCPADEVCCPREVPPSGNNDAEYESSCGPPVPAPEGSPDGCGTTPGNFHYPALCTCDAECHFGMCEPGGIYVSAASADFMRCVP